MQIGGPKPVPNYGDQIQDRAIAGVKPEARPIITYEEIPGEFADGTPFSLRKPTVSFIDPAYGDMPDNVLASARVATPVIGLGLLQSVPEETMRATCGFLGLDYQADMIQPYDNRERKMLDGVVPEDRMHGDQKFIVAHKAIDPRVADTWREHMTSASLGGPARRIAADYGYEIDDPATEEVARACRSRYNFTPIPLPLNVVRAFASATSAAPGSRPAVSPMGRS